MIMKNPFDYAMPCRRRRIPASARSLPSPPGITAQSLRVAGIYTLIAARNRANGRLIAASPEELGPGLLRTLTAPGWIRVAQHCQGLLDPPGTRFRLLGAFDGEHVLALVAVGQAVVGGAGDRVGVQGPREVRWLCHHGGLGVIFDVDLDLVAGRDAGRLPV